MTPLLYVLAIFSQAAQSVTTKLNTKKNTDAVTFHLLKSIGFLAIVAVIYLFDIESNLGTLKYAAAFGVLLALSHEFGYKALTLGPMAKTSTIVTFSLLIPFTYGIVYLHETPGVPQIIGVLLFFVALFLLRSPSPSEPGEGKKTSLKWGIFVAATMCCNGINAIIQKQHQTAYKGHYTAEFTASAGFLVVVLFIVYYAIEKSREKKNHPAEPAGMPTTPDLPPEPKKKLSGAFLLGLISGGFNGSFNFLQLTLAATENASVLYPVLSAGVMLAVYLSGRIFFKEKMTLLQNLGFVVGVCAIVLLKI